MGVRSHDGVHVVALGVDLGDRQQAGHAGEHREVLDDGRRQRTKRGFLRQRDAERALREAIGSVQDGTYVKPSQDTVARGWRSGSSVADRLMPVLPGVTAASSPRRPGLNTARKPTR